MAEFKALIFDCDGVLAETERDGHRVANNKMFENEGIDAFWSVEEYAELLKVAGGKERLKAYFKKDPKKFPADRYLDDDFIKGLHKIKTDIFIELTKSGELKSRSGINRIIHEAKEKGIALFVCSTSQKDSVASLIEANYGEEGLSLFTELLCGDIVSRKKPAPDIYNLVVEKYGFKPEECVVVEDTRNGLLAAESAGMHCIITPSFYSFEEDFTEADVVVSSLGDENDKTVLIAGKEIPLEKGYVSIKDLEIICYSEETK